MTDDRSALHARLSVALEATLGADAVWRKEAVGTCREHGQWAEDEAIVDSGLRCPTCFRTVSWDVQRSPVDWDDPAILWPRWPRRGTRCWQGRCVMTDAEWRDLCRARAEASPGPWWLDAVPAGAQPGGWSLVGGDGDHLLSPGDIGVREWADAHLMAAAPALVDEVRRLRAALADLAADEGAVPPPPADGNLVYAEGYADGADMMAVRAYRALKWQAGDD